MKTKIFALLLSVVAGPVLAQTTINFNNVRNVPTGDLRTVHCSSTSTPPYSCGSNPPIVVLTPADCGHPVALSNVRNAGGATDYSTNGVQAKLPSPADLAAAAGGAMKTCEISFIFGTPSDNFLCIDPNGGPLTGAVNNFNITSGLYCYPYFPGGRLDEIYDSVSWKQSFNGSPEYMAEMPSAAGQLLKHGDVKLFQIHTPSTCPQWITGTAYSAGACVYNAHSLYTTVAGGTSGATAPVCVLGFNSPCSDGVVSWVFAQYFFDGDLALCPWNGNGLIIPGSDGPKGTSNYFTDEILQKIPSSCLTYEPDLAAGSGVDYLEALLNSSNLTCSANITATCPAGIASGVISGNPNGNGGNYIRLVSASNSNMGPVNQIHIFGGTMQGGTVMPQAGVIRLVHTLANNPNEPVPCASTEGTCYDILYQTYNGNPVINGFTTFQPGDTATASYHYYYDGLKAVAMSGTSNVTDPVTGQEADANNFLATIVGGFKLNGGSPNSISDTDTARNVASWYNRTPKKLRCAYSGDQTETSLSPHETSTSIRCPFIVLAVPGTAYGSGAALPGLQYQYDGSASNGTASDGCQSAAAFILSGGALGAAEPGAGKFVNNAVTAGTVMNVGFGGMKMSLTPGFWSITLLNEAITGGTCTMSASGSSLIAYPWQ